MSVKTTITREEYEQVLKFLKVNRHKCIDRKLNIIKLRYEGLSNKEISEKLACDISTITRNIAAFKRKGIKEFSTLKYGGNHRSLTEEEEDKILQSFKKKMNKGEIVTVKEIKQAFDEKIGKDTGRGYIYMLLKRKGFQKWCQEGNVKKSKWRGAKIFEKLKRWPLINCFITNKKTNTIIVIQYLKMKLDLEVLINKSIASKTRNQTDST